MVPISTELKTDAFSPFWLCTRQEQTPCVCLHACTHVGEKKTVHACLFVGTHKHEGESDLLLFSTVIPEVKTTTKMQHSIFSEKLQRKGKHRQFSCKNYHSMVENNNENIME